MAGIEVRNRSTPLRTFVKTFMPVLNMSKIFSWFSFIKSWFMFFMALPNFSIQLLRGAAALSIWLDVTSEMRAMSWLISLISQ